MNEVVHYRLGKEDLSISLEEMMMLADTFIQNYKENLDGDSFVYLIDWILEMKLKIAGVTNVSLCFDNLSDKEALFCRKIYENVYYVTKY